MFQFGDGALVDAIAVGATVKPESVTTPVAVSIPVMVAVCTGVGAEKVIVFPTDRPAVEDSVAEVVLDDDIVGTGIAVGAPQIGCLAKYTVATWDAPRLSYTVIDVELV